MRAKIFCRGPCNAAALALIDSWPDWPARAIALVGPEGSGKTHLATIWAAAAGARVISAHALGEIELPVRARDRRIGRRGCRCDRRRAGAVSPDQPRPRGGGLSPVHRAHRAVDLACGHPGCGFAAAGASGGDAAGAGRCDAARGHRETRRRPPARSRRERSAAICRPISSARSRLRVRPSSLWIRRRCGKGGRRAGRLAAEMFRDTCLAVPPRAVASISFTFPAGIEAGLTARRRAALCQPAAFIGLSQSGEYSARGARTSHGRTRPSHCRCARIWFCAAAGGAGVGSRAPALISPQSRTASSTASCRG